MGEDFGLLPFDDVRPNAPVFEGDVRSARFGEQYTPFGVTANRRLELTGEVAGSALGSDVTSALAPGLGLAAAHILATTLAAEHSRCALPGRHLNR